MDTEQEQIVEQSEYISQDHPWLEIQDINIDEEILYSLDEIRFA